MFNSNDLNFILFMTNQQDDSFSHGCSPNATFDEQIRHESGHVILHWLNCKNPISVTAGEKD